jgi:hypothetical protein
MENEHVLAGLIRKRAEIAGQLEHAQSRVRQLIIDVDNLDATIRLFAPDMDLDEIKSRPIPPRHAAFQGEISRLILDALRESSLPLTTRDVAVHVMQARSLNTADPRLRRTMVTRVGKALRHARVKGTVRSEEGRGGNLRWALA